MNLPEQPREAESIAEEEMCIQNLVAETNNEIDDTKVDNDISASNDVICFIRFVYNNMLKQKT